LLQRHWDGNGFGLNREGGDLLGFSLISPRPKKPKKKKKYLEKNGEG